MPSANNANKYSGIAMTYDCNPEEGQWGDRAPGGKMFQKRMRHAVINNTPGTSGKCTPSPRILIARLLAHSFPTTSLDVSK